MRILSQLVYLSFSVVVPVVLMLLLLWNVVLQAVADALLYKQVQDIADQHNY